MAEFSSPILGMQVRRNVIPANPILGRPEQVFGGGPDPQTMMAIAQNRNAIQSLSVNLDAIAAQMSVVNQSLGVISTQINQSSLIEERQAREKEKQERILAEQALREGKESLVERKIQNALVTPLQKIAAKAQGPLANLGNFFMVLLGGALGMRIISTIEKLSEDGELSMENLFDDIKTDLAIAGGILIGISGGFSLVLGTITSLVGKLGSFLLRNLFLRPIRLVFDIAKGMLSGLKNQLGRLVGLAPKVPGAANAAKGAAAAKGATATKGAARMKAIGAGGMAVSTLIDLGFGGEIDNALVKAVGGAGGAWVGAKSGAIAGAIFGPKGAAVGGFLGGIAGFMAGSSLADTIYKGSGADDAFNFDYTLKDVGLPDFSDLPDLSNMITGTKKDLNVKQEEATTENIVINTVGGEYQLPEINVPGETANNLTNVVSTNFDNHYLFNSYAQYNVGRTF